MRFLLVSRGFIELYGFYFSIYGIDRSRFKSLDLVLQANHIFHINCLFGIRRKRSKLARTSQL